MPGSPGFVWRTDVPVSGWLVSWPRRPSCQTSATRRQTRSLRRTVTYLSTLAGTGHLARKASRSGRTFPRCSTHSRMPGGKHLLRECSTIPSRNCAGCMYRNRLTVTTEGSNGPSRVDGKDLPNPIMTNCLGLRIRIDLMTARRRPFATRAPSSGTPASPMTICGRSSTLTSPSRNLSSWASSSL